VRAAEEPVALPTGEPEDEEAMSDVPEPPPVDDVLDYGADDLDR
jgi:hypothetical protein